MNRTRGKLVTRLLKDVVFFFCLFLNPILSLKKKNLCEKKTRVYAHTNIPHNRLPLFR